MKIVVTGIAGFLGSHLAETLAKKGHDVFGVDNLIGGDPENVPDGVNWFVGDTSDYEQMDLFFKAFKPDVIYHCACTAYEGFSVFSPALVTYHTYQNTVALLSASIANNVKRFVYCSSMSRYGKQKAPFTEDMPTAPEDPYALGKDSAEKLIKMMAETFGFEYAIAVPHNIIGPKQKYDDPFRNVASIFINRILQGKPPIIYGDGLQTRSFSFISDCIYPLVRMIDCPSGEIYNIGPDDRDGEVVTVKALAKIISHLMGYKGEFEYVADRPREVKHAFCSSDKIRKDFGYKTRVKLADGLQVMINDIRKKGVKPFAYHLPLEITKNCPTTWKEKRM